MLDYTAQTFAVALDGTTLASNLTFCGNNFGPCNDAPVTSMGLRLFDTFGSGNDCGAFDNFSMATPASGPEPASLMLFASALLTLGLPRRRRA